MVAQSLLDPITMAIRAGLLREDMRLKTPVGVLHTALEATENTTISRQGKRLRRRKYREIVGEIKTGNR
ncbi:MarR family transcriptional regulator [Klebsiella aerogenes]|nr:MarR family transcriptional regulator [Klebsiella aerogenes]AUY89200.1 MarR family transcriptional regulator [Klebsiella aerogenes]AUZ17024.1 MarR family transcriptional regulator [Klebsiella aerogenes]AVE40340.1 MarR family transcriptional regulator [Klebsiella aerogenes]AXY31820.1 MarR family transcriptional regulator [Klebsiella aerogenes]